MPRPSWIAPARLLRRLPAPGAALLADRRLAAAVAAGALLLVGLEQIGIVAWQCPIDSLFGRPCPGCGLTRAVGQLLCGQWRTALASHPLAPAASLAVLALLTVSILPQPLGGRIAAEVERMERRTGCTLLLLTAMLVIWGARL